MTLNQPGRGPQLRASSAFQAALCLLLLLALTADLAAEPPLARGAHRAAHLLARSVAEAAAWLREAPRSAAAAVQALAHDTARRAAGGARRSWRRLCRAIGFHPTTRWAAVQDSPPEEDRRPAFTVRTGNPTPGASGPGPTEPAAWTRPLPGASGLRRTKTAEELRVEGLIDQTLRRYFRQYRIEGRTYAVRMPFGLNAEREDGRGYSQEFALGAKGSPDELWPTIDQVFGSAAFAKYAQRLLAPGAKVVIYDLRRGSYSVSVDPALLRALDHGPYPGSPTRIYVRRGGGQLLESDLYDYLYAVARIGLDCSGLSYALHASLAQACDLDLDRLLGAQWRLKPEHVARWVGLGFYDPAGGYADEVEDCIEDLRPGDVLLFRGRDGQFKHSAVIQSVDLDNGLLRYAQSTDWAPQEERGVHLSVARFDPGRPRVSLRHYSVRWLQQVRPPFAGEREPADWMNDGDRYLWYPEVGGSCVVRVRALAAALLEREPRFYTNLYAPAGPPAAASAAATSSSTPAAPPAARSPAAPR